MLIYILYNNDIFNVVMRNGKNAWQWPVYIENPFRTST